MSYPPGVTQWHIDYYAGGYDEPPEEEEDPMTEAEELRDEIRKLEARKVELIAVSARHELALNWCFPHQERVLEALLDEIYGEIDEIGDKLGPLQRDLYEIEGRASREEGLRDSAYGRNP